MNVGILFEGSPKNPGGFYQSLNSALILNEIKEYKENLTFITLDNHAYKNLINKKLKTIFFKKNITSKIFQKLYSIDTFGELLKKFKIYHPFTNFLKNNNFDLVIFLSPHYLSLYCADINFIINIWDLDHKKNSPYPEHKGSYTYEKREKFLNHILFKAFKIVVAHEQNKKDLLNIYSCNEDKIVVQTFIPYLPTLIKKEKKNLFNYKDAFSKYKIPFEKKILFYPATFWPHKNHKYIIDTAKILAENSNDSFHFLFCGSDRGNFKFIQEEIKKNRLEKLITTIPFATNEEIILFYNNVFGVVMPTTGGPTNLPLYEAFFFKKPIFYTKNLLDDEAVKDAIIEIDINDPKDFYNKLLNLDQIDLEKIKSYGYEYYINTCSSEVFKKNYTSILNEFKYAMTRWKIK